MKIMEIGMWICVGICIEAILVLIFAYYHMGIFANCY